MSFSKNAKKRAPPNENALKSPKVTYAVNLSNMNCVETDINSTVPQRAMLASEFALSVPT